MSYKVSSHAESVTAYVNEVMTLESPLQKRLREETATLPESEMQISPHQGSVIALLVKMTGAANALEIGTFTGYSAMAIASALKPGGKLTCCDVSDTWTSIARRYWQEAGLADRIELRLGPALASLDALIAAGSAPFDFVFIDADKTGYDAYYERSLQLLRPGGVIVLDNMLRDGEVCDPTRHNPGTDAIRALNLKIRDDRRVDCALLTVGDGFLVARKR